jgi:hypothetical protein
VRHPQHRILRGTPAATSPRSAAVTSPRRQLGLHHRTQPRGWSTSLAALGRPGPAGRPQRPRPAPGNGDGRHCGPPPATPSTAPVPVDGRSRGRSRPPPDRGRSLPLRHQQGPGCPTRRPALDPAGLQHKGTHRRSPFAKPPSDQPQRRTPPPPLPYLLLLHRRQPPRAHDHLQPPDPSEVLHSPMETAVDSRHLCTLEPSG